MTDEKYNPLVLKWVDDISVVKIGRELIAPEQRPVRELHCRPNAKAFAASQAIGCIEERKLR